MDELLRQLSDLALGAVPTMIIFLLLLVAYRFLVYGPMMRTLAERRERTAGAVARAHAAIAAADARAQEYEAKLRAARAEIFRRREQRIHQWNVERESALAAARLAAQGRVRTAQEAIYAQASEARNGIEAAADQLVAQVLAAVLPSQPATAEGAR
jgi:F-type H+-transporting ATPase subunit b